MNGKQWYWARIRWAVMEEGGGLRRWEEKVCIFLSQDREMAFQRALAIGRRSEHGYEETRKWVETRLAEVVTLDCLGAEATEFEIDVESPRVTERLRFEHEFDPAGSRPSPLF